MTLQSFALHRSLLASIQARKSLHGGAQAFAVVGGASGLPGAWVCGGRLERRPGWRPCPLTWLCIQVPAADRMWLMMMVRWFNLQVGAVMMVLKEVKVMVVLCVRQWGPDVEKVEAVERAAA